MKPLLTEQDIISTYDKRQQEQCRLYHAYLKIKEENPSFGYKRIAKLLNQPYGKTRWWHAKKHIPVPIQTANWLKEKGLIPLTAKHSNMPQISKVLGTTFGDGGIFANLNAIFLSSSELEAAKEFGEDLKIIFGNEIELNSRKIEGGEYGHSWCYQNTNRNIIRFFQALGAPIGRKSELKLKIPSWVFTEERVIDEFIGSFFGSELNVPKVHINKTHLDTLSIAITGPPSLEENRINFLQEIKSYLEKKGVITGSICKTRNRKRDDSLIFKLLISTRLDNFIRFKERIKISYCVYKKQKLEKTLNDFINIKKQRYKDLIMMGYTEEASFNLLRISGNSSKLILSVKH